MVPVAATPFRGSGRQWGEISMSECMSVGRSGVGLGRPFTDRRFSGEDVEGWAGADLGVLVGGSGALADYEDRMHAALRAGANGYVSKNLPIEQLYCVLSRVLAGSQQRARRDTVLMSHGPGHGTLLGAA